MQENHHCIRNNMGKVLAQPKAVACLFAWFCLCSPDDFMFFMQPCLMCSEILFDSVKEIITLPCGHATHQRCHSESRFPTCLVCARTAEDDALTQDILRQACSAVSTDLLHSAEITCLCPHCRSREIFQYTTLGSWCTACNCSM
jgi:hypothetical protein